MTKSDTEDSIKLINENKALCPDYIPHKVINNTRASACIPALNCRLYNKSLPDDISNAYMGFVSVQLLEDVVKKITKLKARQENYFKAEMRDKFWV